MKSSLRLALFALLSLLMLISASCTPPTNTSYDKEQIRQILTNIKLAYEQHDIDGIMQYYNSSFLHNGMHTWQAEELWLDRMSEYPYIDFEDITIELDVDDAVATFTMKLQNPEETVYSDEPQDNGDTSYFVYEDDKWQVFGNQHP